MEQIARIERRQQRLRRLRTRFQTALNVPHSSTMDSEPAPDIHHHIGKSQNEYESIGEFLSQNAGDPAIQVPSLILQLFQPHC